jgi:hypothetical protein
MRFLTYRRFRRFFHSKAFLTVSGTLASTAWIVKDLVPMGGVIHSLCVSLVGLGLFLGTWSTTTRAPESKPQEPPHE